MGKDQDLLAHVWGLYRVYATTSRKIKSNTTRYRTLVIMFTIVAAISGVLTTQFPDGTMFPLSVFGFLSAASFSLATFFSREIIKSAYEKKHIIARSAAESLKSQSYLYATGTTPYTTADANTLLLEKSKTIRINTEDILLANITDEEKKKYLISKAMSVEAYIKERILDQVNTYYNPSSQKNSKTINKWNRIVFIGGLAGIVLAAAGAFGFSVYTAAWVAVIGTITTSITAYLFAGRYSYLALSYQSTAMQLKDHLAEWHISDKSNKSASDLIISCERTISIENQAWMAELSKKSKAIVPESIEDIDKKANHNHDD